MALLVGLASALAGQGQDSGPDNGPNSGQAPVFKVLYVQMASTISPAQEDLLRESLARCRDQGFQMLLLRLDTPGGLGESMREMVKMILNSPVPVGVWVGPSGARAASAGVFLVAAADVSAMSPQSTIGAASPVQVGGGDITGTMAEKVKNDIVSLVRGVAESRGRNAEWYVEAVEKSVSVSADQALKLRVVDFVAATPLDFLAQAGARGVGHGGKRISFSEAEIRLVEHEPGFRYLFLSWLLHPQVAYFLLLGGLAGLFFELTTPGAVFPGVFGGICLLMALYALSILPTNIAGLLLILFGLVLFGLEIKVTSYGMLSVGGLVCLFIGSVILYRTESGFEPLSLGTTLPTALVLSGLVALVVFKVAKAQSGASTLGQNAMVGLEAVVLEWAGDRGKVFVRGEIWSATAGPDRAGSGWAGPVVGGQVVIEAVKGLTLFVGPAGRPEDATK
ncbi:MAG: nodulation protein NfeD [Desulfovibrionaceae bacterium]|nr:nodulation protein NfeD [Desulfovibrionaceae bacterium]